MPTRVSVISVFYNRQDLVGDSVRSLLGQERADEIILVDDGSTDATGERLDAFAGGAVRVVRQANRGFTPTMAAMVEQAAGDYIAIHGSGDLSLPGRFAAQAAALDADAGLAAVGCWRRMQQVGRGTQERRAGFGADAARTLLRRNPYSQGEVMFRRGHYRQAGGYRAVFRFAQDRDLWCRMSRVGRLDIVEQELYHQFSHVPGSVSGTPHKRLLQRFFSDAAVWCHREALAGRGDPIDRFGPDAVLMRPRSARLARALAVEALGYRRSGDAAAARLFAEASWIEAWTLPGAFARLRCG